MDKKKSILITGAQGQLGNELRLILDKNQFDLIFIDRAELDVSDQNAVEDFFEKNRIDIVINCAAYTAVDKAENEHDFCYAVNERAVSHIASVCKAKDIFLFHISTDFVFSGKSNLPINELEEANPVSVYGKSKLAGETAVIESECNYIIIRTSWLYSGFGSNFVKTILRLAQEREAIGVVYDQIGSPTYAADLADVILKFITHDDFENLTGLYHFSNSGVASWYDFAIAVKRINHLRLSIKPIETKDYPTPASRPVYSVMNCSKIKETLNIEIPHWQESLKTCLQKLEN